jgi:hypothetical protein
MLVTNLLKIRFPVIVSLVGKYSSYNHVVVVWKKKIIDIEHEFPIELPVDNVDCLAGKRILFIDWCVDSVFYHQGQ